MTGIAFFALGSGGTEKTISASRKLSSDESVNVVENVAAVDEDDGDDEDEDDDAFMDAAASAAPAADGPADVGVGGNPPFHHDGGHRRLGYVQLNKDGTAGIDFPFPVTLSTEVSEISTSATTNQVWKDPIRAKFGGKVQCCPADSYANPDTTVKWSEWGEPDAARAAKRAAVIPCGTKVLLDASAAGDLALKKGLIIKGSLEVPDTGGELAIETAYVYNCGSLVAHLQSGNTKLTFTLIGHEKIALPGKNGFSTKGFVTQGGNTDLRGNLCNRTTWALLAATADAGATELKLDRAVEWPVGTQFMLASTDWKGSQTEVATVTRVSDGGKTLGIKAGLVYPHAGVFPITAEVGALTRNIKITSEAACRQIPNKEATDKPMCGHFVVDHTPHAIVCGIEVTNMGKPVGI